MPTVPPRKGADSDLDDARPRTDDLFLQTGLFCAGLIASVLIMVMLWATPALMKSPTMVARSTASAAAQIQLR
jgi:hypothetical protein